ncbi:MAG: zinc finger domain-containing protein, partial [Actinomycetales bacterium]
GPPEPTGAVRLRLVGGHGWADLRGPAACEVLTAGEASAVVGSLGPDPLHGAPGAADDFARRVRARRTVIAQLLMDQKVLAGIGNIYRAELLFRQRLNPQTPGTSVDQETAQRLWTDAAGLLADGVRDGRILSTDPRDRNRDLAATAVDAAAAGGAAAVPADQAHYVYQRAQLPCRICGTLIASADLAGRKLYWCPHCQQ